MLVVVADGGEDASERLERREDVETDRHVFLHVRELLGRERAGLVEHGLADADFAHVHDAAGEAHVLDLVVGEAELCGDGGGEIGDAVGVAAEERVLGFLCVDECLHDVDDHPVQHEALALELLGLCGHFLADEPFDLALLDREIALVQHALDGGREIGELDRLHEVIHRPVRERFGGGGCVVDGGEHHHREVGVDRERGGHERQARHAGHADVRQHEDVLLALECFQGGRPGITGGDLVAFGAKELRQRATDQLLVVDDEDSAHLGLGDGPNGAAESRRLGDTTISHEGQASARGPVVPWLRYALAREGPPVAAGLL